MTETALWSVFGLGAFHGINPAMGWLFAVALGLQERRRFAVWRALLPLTVGHALAIGAALLAAILLGAALPPVALKLSVGAALAGLGVYRLFRHRHPSAGGMRVSMAGLTLWSFLMASAHGAGLMVAGVAAPACHSASHGLTATLVHGAGYLVVTALAAWIVFEKLGLGLLRKAWINLDLIWAVALIATGALTLAL